MKRSLALCALLCLLLALSGCRAARVPGLEWDPEEMVELQLYQGAVPADAQRKTTTDPEKIRQAAQALFSLRVERDAVNEDVPAGGDRHLFRLCPGGLLPRGDAPGQRRGIALHWGGLLQAAP